MMEKRTISIEVSEKTLVALDAALAELQFSTEEGGANEGTVEGEANYTEAARVINEIGQRFNEQG